MNALLIAFGIAMFFILIYMIHAMLILFEDDIDWLRFKISRILRKNKKIKK